MDSDIQNFFKHKAIFLTGGTGFVGKALIEKLLRVADVERIYVLIRPKRGKDIHQRMEDVFRDPLFEKIQNSRPDITDRVTAIFGDCTLPNLGLSNNDYETLIEHVEVVVHGAATVRFNEPLSNALAINVRGTLSVLQLAKKMINLQALIHVSSAFANCTVSHVEEQYYAKKLLIGAEAICKVADILGASTLNRMARELCQDFPNTYCFTKALAEEAVLSHGNELPICIFRPGIVSPTLSEPVAGWIDNLYGPTSILYGVAIGVLRVMYVRFQANAALLPVDYCANAILACAWETAKSATQRTNSPPAIYNLVPDESNLLKWSQYRRSVEENGKKIPLTRMLWYPFLIDTQSKILYNILIFFYHTLAGYFFDFFLLLAGKERRMAKIYRKIHKQTSVLAYFIERDWTFSMDNTKKLWKQLSADDQRLFPFDMAAINWDDYFCKSLYGMRQYLAKEDPSTIPKGRRLMKRLIIVHRAVQVLVYGGAFGLIAWMAIGVCR